jgi:hypothetical protein
MDEQTFQGLLHRARDAEASGDDACYWRAYQRGLWRAYRGEAFGTSGEHALWLAFADSSGPIKSALGRGYRDGLAGVERCGTGYQPIAARGPAQRMVEGAREAAD